MSNLKLQAVLVIGFLLVCQPGFCQTFVEPDPNEDLSKFLPGFEGSDGKVPGMINTGSGHVDVMNALATGLNDMPSSRIKILLMPGVIEELELTKYQLHQVELIQVPEPAYIHKADAELTSYGSIFTIEKKDVPAFKSRMRMLFRKAIDAANEKLDTILDTRQMKRLKQIEFQHLVFHTRELKKAFEASGMKVSGAQLQMIEDRIGTMDVTFENTKLLVLPQLEKAMACRSVFGHKVVGRPFAFHNGDQFKGVAELTRRLMMEDDEETPSVNRRRIGLD